MEPIFKHQVTVTQMQVDRFGRTRPAVLLYFIQEAAGQHCSLLGVDYDTLAKQNLFWAVTRTHVQITRLPRLGERVFIETWPMPTTRVAYPRSVVAYDEAGQELFRSISLWVLMDADSRAMVLPGKSGIDVNGTVTGKELSVPRAIVSRPMENNKACTVGYSLLDRNGHMNNTRYMDWVDDLLSSDFHKEHPAKEFTVCYMNEAREGDEIALSYALEDAVLTVDATREGDRIFSAQIQY